MKKFGKKVREYAEANVRLLKQIKKKNYDDKWCAPFAKLVEEQKAAVKRTLNWLRLDPDFQFNSIKDLLEPKFKSGSEQLGKVICDEVDAIFDDEFKSRKNS